MRTFSPLTSRALLLPRDDVDTDQIIPARFLTVTGRGGLGRVLFADWRYAAAGGRFADFPLDVPGVDQSRILVTGRNFGCGSSREHAAWALLDFGFLAVVSPSFADIFRTNALKNGLLPVELPPEDHQALVELLARDPEQPVTIDLVSLTVALPALPPFRFTIEPFARHCLLQGVDELRFLLDQEELITEYERGRPGPVLTR